MKKELVKIILLHCTRAEICFKAGDIFGHYMFNPMCKFKDTVDGFKIVEGKGGCSTTYENVIYIKILS